MKKGVIALLACVFALSLALVGCGGSGGGDAKAAWVGTWDLTEMEENGTVTGPDDLKALKDYGLDVYLELNSDGTGALVLFGESMSGKWEAKSATEGTFEYEGQKVDMKIAEGKLSMVQSGSRLTFEKGEPRSSAAASSAASSAAASSEAASSAAASSEAASSSASSSSAS